MVLRWAVSGLPIRRIGVANWGFARVRSRPVKRGPPRGLGRMMATAQPFPSSSAQLAELAESRRAGVGLLTLKTKAG